jgi:hypothetical protein
MEAPMMPQRRVLVNCGNCFSQASQETPLSGVERAYWLVTIAEKTFQSSQTWGIA